MKKALIPNQAIAFTGPLRSLSRNEAIDMVYDLGGTYCSSVSKKTTLLVTNILNPFSLDPSQRSTKLQRAISLIEQGSNLRIISEDELFE